MGRHQQLLKFVAIFVIMCLLAQDAAMALPSQTTDYRPQTKAKAETPGVAESHLRELGRLSIPQNLGKIDEEFYGSNGKHITFILDAHDSLDAQKNIVRLIQLVVKERGVQTVFEEGYEGELNTDLWFGGIEDPQIKRKVSYYYLDQLKIGAAEFAHINRSEIRNQRSEIRLKDIVKIPGVAGRISGSWNGSDDWALIGADDKEAYLENVRAFGDSEKVRAQILRDTQAITRELKNLGVKTFSTEAQKWIAERERFQNQTLPLSDYLHRWIEKIPAAECPLLRQLLRAEKDPELVRNIQKIRATEILNELETFEAALENKLFGGLTPVIARNSLDEARDKLRDRGNPPSLCHSRGGGNLDGIPDQAGDDPACQIASLPTGRQAPLARNDNLVEPLQTWQALKAMQEVEKLAELKISRHELAQLKNNLKNIRTEKLAPMIARAKKNPVVLSKRWETLIQTAMKFYELAHKRDEAVERALIAWRDQSKAYNIQRTAQNESVSSGVSGLLPRGDAVGSVSRHDQNSNAVLVFGGFHREGITEILRRNGFSYTVVIPKIAELSPRHQEIYRRLMTGSVPSAARGPIRQAQDRLTPMGSKNAARPTSGFLTPNFDPPIEMVRRIVDENPNRDPAGLNLLIQRESEEKNSTTAVRGIIAGKARPPSLNTRRLFSPARAESRETTIRIQEEIDLGSLLESWINEWRRVYPHANFTLNIASREPVVLRDQKIYIGKVKGGGDVIDGLAIDNPKKKWEAMLNLSLEEIVDNAVHGGENPEERAIKKREITVTLDVQNGNAMINILDNGKGIDPEVVRKINAREYVTTKKTIDHGLGYLTRISPNMERMGIRLEIHSFKNSRQGTAIRLFIPLQAFQIDTSKEELSRSEARWSPKSKRVWGAMAAGTLGLMAQDAIQRVTHFIGLWIKKQKKPEIPFRDEARELRQKIFFGKWESSVEVSEHVKQAWRDLIPKEIYRRLGFDPKTVPIHLMKKNEEQTDAPGLVVFVEEGKLFLHLNYDTKKIPRAWRENLISSAPPQHIKKIRPPVISVSLTLHDANTTSPWIFIHHGYFPPFDEAIEQISGRKFWFYRERVFIWWLWGSLLPWLQSLQISGFQIRPAGLSEGFFRNPSFENKFVKKYGPGGAYWRMETTDLPDILKPAWKLFDAQPISKTTLFLRGATRFILNGDVFSEGELKIVARSIDKFLDPKREAMESSFTSMTEELAALLDLIEALRGKNKLTYLQEKNLALLFENIASVSLFTPAERFVLLRLIALKPDGFENLGEPGAGQSKTFLIERAMEQGVLAARRALLNSEDFDGNQRAAHDLLMVLLEEKAAEKFPAAASLAEAFYASIDEQGRALRNVKPFDLSLAGRLWGRFFKLFYGDEKNYLAGLIDIATATHLRSEEMRGFLTEKIWHYFHGKIRMARHYEQSGKEPAAAIERELLVGAISQVAVLTDQRKTDWFFSGKTAEELVSLMLDQRPPDEHIDAISLFLRSLKGKEHAAGYLLLQEISLSESLLQGVAMDTEIDHRLRFYAYGLLTQGGRDLIVEKREKLAAAADFYIDGLIHNRDAQDDVSQPKSKRFLESVLGGEELKALNVAVILDVWKDGRFGRDELDFRSPAKNVALAMDGKILWGYKSVNAAHEVGSGLIAQNSMPLMAMAFAHELGHRILFDLNFQLDTDPRQTIHEWVSDLIAIVYANHNQWELKDFLKFIHAEKHYSDHLSKHPLQGRQVFYRPGRSQIWAVLLKRQESTKNASREQVFDALLTASLMEIKRLVRKGEEPQVDLFFRNVFKTARKILKKDPSSLRALPKPLQFTEGKARSESRNVMNAEQRQLANIWPGYAAVFNSKKLPPSEPSAAFLEWLKNKPMLELGPGQGVSLADQLHHHYGNKNAYTMDAQPLVDPSSDYRYATRYQQSFTKPWPFANEYLKVIYSHWALGGEVRHIYPAAWFAEGGVFAETAIAKELERALHPDGFAYLELGEKPNPRLVQAFMKQGLLVQFFWKGAFVQAGSKETDKEVSNALEIIVTKKPIADVIHQIQAELEATELKLSQQRSEARAFETLQGKIKEKTYQAIFDIRAALMGVEEPVEIILYGSTAENNDKVPGDLDIAFNHTMTAYHDRQQAISQSLLSQLEDKGYNIDRPNSYDPVLGMIPDFKKSSPANLVEAKSKGYFFKGNNFVWIISKETVQEVDLKTGETRIYQFASQAKKAGKKIEQIKKGEIAMTPKAFHSQRWLKNDWVKSGEKIWAVIGLPDPRDAKPATQKTIKGITFIKRKSDRHPVWVIPPQDEERFKTAFAAELARLGVKNRSEARDTALNRRLQENKTPFMPPQERSEMRAEKVDLYPAAIALTYEIKFGEQGSEVTLRFDLEHVAPPYSPRTPNRDIFFGRPAGGGAATFGGRSFRSEVLAETNPSWFFPENVDRRWKLSATSQTSDQAQKTELTTRDFLMTLMRFSEAPDKRLEQLYQILMARDLLKAGETFVEHEKNEDTTLTPIWYDHVFHDLMKDLYAENLNKKIEDYAGSKEANRDIFIEQAKEQYQKYLEARLEDLLAQREWANSRPLRSYFIRKTIYASAAFFILSKEWIPLFHGGMWWVSMLALTVFSVMGISEYFQYRGIMKQSRKNFDFEIEIIKSDLADLESSMRSEMRVNQLDSGGELTRESFLNNETTWVVGENDQPGDMVFVFEKFSIFAAVGAQLVVWASPGKIRSVQSSLAEKDLYLSETKVDEADGWTKLILIPFRDKPKKEEPLFQIPGWQQTWMGETEKIKTTLPAMLEFIWQQEFFLTGRQQHLFKNVKIENSWFHPELDQDLWALRLTYQYEESNQEDIIVISRDGNLVASKPGELQTKGEIKTLMPHPSRRIRAFERKKSWFRRMIGMLLRSGAIDEVQTAFYAHDESGFMSDSARRAVMGFEKERDLFIETERFGSFERYRIRLRDNPKFSAGIMTPFEKRFLGSEAGGQDLQVRRISGFLQNENENVLSIGAGPTIHETEMAALPENKMRNFILVDSYQVSPELESTALTPWERRSLPAQQRFHAYQNLALLKADVRAVLESLPEKSINTLVLVNPNAHVLEAVLQYIVERQQSSFLRENWKLYLKPHYPLDLEAAMEEYEDPSYETLLNSIAASQGFLKQLRVEELNTNLILDVNVSENTPWNKFEKIRLITARSEVRVRTTEKKEVIRSVEELRATLVKSRISNLNPYVLHELYPSQLASPRWLTKAEQNLLRRIAEIRDLTKKAMRKKKRENGNKFHDPFAPANLRNVMKVLKYLGAKEGERIIDLGHGEGSVLFAAAALFGLRGVGGELDAYRFRKSTAIYKALVREGLVKANAIELKNQNFNELDFQSADYVFFFSFGGKVDQDKLIHELKPGAKFILLGIHNTVWQEDNLTDYSDFSKLLESGQFELQRFPKLKTWVFTKLPARSETRKVGEAVREVIQKHYFDVKPLQQQLLDSWNQFEEGWAVDKMRSVAASFVTIQRSRSEMRKRANWNDGIGLWNSPQVIDRLREFVLDPESVSYWRLRASAWRVPENEIDSVRREAEKQSKDWSLAAVFQRPGFSPLDFLHLKSQYFNDWVLPSNDPDRYAVYPLWEDLIALSRNIRQSPLMIHVAINRAATYSIWGHGTANALLREIKDDYKRWEIMRAVEPDLQDEWAMLNIMIDGEISAGEGSIFVGMDLRGNTTDSWGPFWVLTRDRARSYIVSPSSRENHWAYLVPNQAAIDFFEKGLELAVNRKMMTEEERQDVRSKLITFEEFNALGEWFWSIRDKEITIADALTQIEFARSEMRISDNEQKVIEIFLSEIDSANYQVEKKPYDLSKVVGDVSINFEKRHVVMPDAHGDLYSFLEVLYHAGMVDKKGHWTGEDSVLVQLGDVLDHGPDGVLIYNLLARLQTEAREAKGEVVRLIGNHEWDLYMALSGDESSLHRWAPRHALYSGFILSALGVNEVEQVDPAKLRKFILEENLKESSLPEEQKEAIRRVRRFYYDLSHDLLLGRVQAAYAQQGVLLTHAGLSDHSYGENYKDVTDPQVIAEDVNKRLKQAAADKNNNLALFDVLGVDQQEIKVYDQSPFFQIKGHSFQSRHKAVFKYGGSPPYAQVLFLDYGQSDWDGTRLEKYLFSFKGSSLTEFAFQAKNPNRHTKNAAAQASLRKRHRVKGSVIRATDSNSDQGQGEKRSEMRVKQWALGAVAATSMIYFTSDWFARTFTEALLPDSQSALIEVVIASGEQRALLALEKYYQKVQDDKKRGIPNRFYWANVQFIADHPSPRVRNLLAEMLAKEGGGVVPIEALIKLKERGVPQEVMAELFGQQGLISLENYLFLFKDLTSEELEFFINAAKRLGRDGWDFARTALGLPGEYDGEVKHVPLELLLNKMREPEHAEFKALFVRVLSERIEAIFEKNSKALPDYWEKEREHVAEKILAGTSISTEEDLLRSLLHESNPYRSEIRSTFEMTRETHKQSVNYFKRIVEDSKDFRGKARAQLVLSVLADLEAKYLIRFFEGRAAAHQLTLENYEKLWGGTLDISVLSGDKQKKLLNVEQHFFQDTFTILASRRQVNYKVLNFENNVALIDSLKKLMVARLETAGFETKPMIFRLTALGDGTELRAIVELLERIQIDLLKDSKLAALLEKQEITNLTDLAKALSFDFRFYDLTHDQLQNIEVVAGDIQADNLWFRPKLSYEFANLNRLETIADWPNEPTAFVISRNVFTNADDGRNKDFSQVVAETLESNGVYVLSVSEAKSLFPAMETQLQLIDEEPTYLGGKPDNYIRVAQRSSQLAAASENQNAERRYAEILTDALKRVGPEIKREGLVEIQTNLPPDAEDRLDQELKKLAVYFATQKNFEKAAVMFWLIKDDKVADGLAQEMIALKDLGEQRKALVLPDAQRLTPTIRESKRSAVSGPKARILISYEELGNNKTLTDEHFLAFYKILYQNQELEVVVYGPSSNNPTEEMRVGMLRAVPQGLSGRISFCSDIHAAMSGSLAWIELASHPGERQVGKNKLATANIQTLEGIASGLLAAMGMDYDDNEGKGYVRVTSAIEISRFFEFLSWQVFAASA